MGVRIKKRIKRDWSAVFEEFHGSGLTIKEFCQIKEMSPSLFYCRRKEYDEMTTASKTALRPSDFIPLPSAAISRPSASIVFPGPIELSLHNECDKELLQHIISQLKGSSC